MLSKLLKRLPTTCQAWIPLERCGSSPVTSASQATRSVPPGLGCWATAYPTNAKTTSRPMSPGHPARCFIASPPQKDRKTSPTPTLPIEPQGRRAIAVVETVVGGEVFHIRLPGTGDHVGASVHIVLLLRRTALDVEDDLLARLQVLRAPLFL